MPRNTKEAPKFDPWTAYQVRSHNKKFDGDSYGIRFMDGIGIIHALEPDEELQLLHESGECSCGAVLKLANTGETPPEKDECQERIDLLMRFVNTNPLLKKVPVDPDEPDGDTEWRTYDAYHVEPYDPSVRRTPKKTQRIGFREMAEVSMPAGAPIKVKGGA